MARLNNSVVYHLLGSYGFTGTFNDRLFKYLGSLGFTGTLSDRLYKYLGSLGLTGAMNDRLKKWDGALPPAWSPGALLPPGQPGFWAGGFAPTSLRIFQDAAGTIPANQAGQPVGKVVRAAGTVDATQATALSRPTLARMPKGGRRNIAYAYGASASTGIIVTPGQPDPHGGNLASRVQFSGAQQTITFSPSGVGTGIYSSRLFVKGVAGETIRRRLPGSVGETNVTLSGDWQDMEVLNSESNSQVMNLNTWSNATARDLLVYAPQVVIGPTLGPYQHVVSDFDITEVGVPDVWHLWNDGGDSLPAILPAGAYEIAWATPLGAVSYASVTSDGTTGTELLRAERMADVLAREGSFTPAEKTALEAYWQQRYAA